MLTTAALRDLRDRLGSTRTLSIFLGESAEDPAGRTMGRRTLAHLLDHLQDDLRGASHAERVACEQAVSHAQERLGEIPFSTRFSGWVAFVTAEAVMYAEMVPVAMPTRVSWSNGPRLAPYLRAFGLPRPTAVAVMDSASARLFLWKHGVLAEQETVTTDLTLGSMDHMGAPPRPGFHTGTRGTSGADVAEQEQRTRLTKHVHAVGDRLMTLAAADGRVLVGGIPTVAQMMVSHVVSERRGQARVLAGLDVNDSAAGVAARTAVAVGEWAQELDLADLTALAEQGYPGGLAAFGLTPVFAALRDGAVDRLLISEHFLDRWPKEVESALELALDTRAQLRYLTGAAGERLDSVGGGIAARLRFPVLVPSTTAGLEVQANG
ncbi:hypothetical protein [Gemmatimonas sp.]|uniref:baeRF10 domain-containing protein n=1 Tax=Gemmatimonas sp. TaxID=1962908 RepID=UPI0022C2F19E|nr:hypothetical protein [Gemmatimonas sp.]MCZ8205028.1 hypothetical protein [Gemmatimonas sp.]